MVKEGVDFAGSFFKEGGGDGRRSGLAFSIALGCGGKDFQHQGGRG